MRIRQCRVCKNKKLVTIGSLGKIAISDFTDIPSEGHKYPLELVYCQKCTLLQLAHNTPRDLLYRHYWYVSGLNPVIVADLKEIAKEAKGRSHLDIGGNDGTLLKHSKARYKLLVDPSDISPMLIPRIQDYFENVRLGTRFDTITAIACLYDLPTPNQFMQNIKRHLNPDGVFIAQLMTLQPFIENNDVGNICHEHLLYFSYKSLVRLYEQNGLEIYKVEKKPMNGGSYRIFARHYQKGSIKFKEKEYGVKELKDFFKRIEESKRLLLQFVSSKKVIGFGASTKMGTITQYYDYTPQYIVDVNPTKLGKYTVSGAQIVDKIPSGTQYLWVFPYGFIEYFKKKEKGYRGKWITTIPKFKIL